jgi:hypothetical protein
MVAGEDNGYLSIIKLFQRGYSEGSGPGHFERKIYSL